MEQMKNYENVILGDQLGFSLYACSKEIVKRYKPLLDELDLTYTQFITMTVMWERRSVNVKSLGECLFLDSGTLTPVLKTLEKKGYVARERSSADERVLIISVTDKGFALQNKAMSVPEDVENDINLSAEERSQLNQLLRKMMEKF